MANQVFHFSNAGITSGQRYYLKDNVSGIFVRNLNIDSNFPIVGSNLVYNTGNQTISGVKTFANIISTSIISGISGAGGIDIRAENASSAGSFGDNVRIFAGSGSTIGGSISLFAGSSSIGSPGDIKFRAGKSQGFFSKGIIELDGNLNINPYLGNPGDTQYPTRIIIYRTGSYGSVTSDILAIDQSSAVLALKNGINISGLISGNNLTGIFSTAGAIPLGLPNNPLSVVGSGNTYIQANIQNRATGTNATADLVITANNGTDTTNYINLGINNSGYNDPNFSNGSAFDGYLFVNGGNLDIGTQTLNTAIEFHAGGTTAANTTARINSSGLDLINNKIINAVPDLLNISANFNISENQNGRMILANSTTTITGYIVSGNATGFNTSIIQVGAGQIQITGSGSNVIVNSYNNQFRTVGQYAAISLLHTGNNRYIMYGNTI